jgi:hypothetical protein
MVILAEMVSLVDPTGQDLEKSNIESLWMSPARA